MYGWGPQFLANWKPWLTTPQNCRWTICYDLCHISLHLEALQWTLQEWERMTIVSVSWCFNVKRMKRQQVCRNGKRINACQKVHHFDASLCGISIAHRTIGEGRRYPHFGSALWWVGVDICRCSSVQEFLTRRYVGSPCGSLWTFVVCSV